MRLFFRLERIKMTIKENGYIYILINQSMPGLVKVGFTTRSLEKRLEELNTTGIPMPFQIGAAFAVFDPKKCESKIHEILKKYRLNNNREFFKIELLQVIELTYPIIKNQIIKNGESTFSSNLVENSSEFELDEIEIILLRTILNYNSKYDFGTVTTYILSRGFHELTNIELEYKLAKLIDRGLIKKFDSCKESESKWKMTPLGTKFMFENDYVEGEVRTRRW